MDTRNGNIYDEATLERLRTAQTITREDEPYIKQMRVAPTPIQRATAKIERNEPCPCGSQKKFKKCCLGKAV